MARFDEALATHPAPTTLGDVGLRYEPSMLIGETAKPERTWVPTGAWVLGVGLLLVALGVLLQGEGVLPVVVLVAAAAIALGGAVWGERYERRQRRFVANFGTVSLRLDFSTPISGQPRTVVVPFGSVRAVDLGPQADGAGVLTVDFVHERRVFREVLAASIPVTQREDAERLRRVLEGAFGLGAPPDDAPVRPHDESSFEPSR